MVICVYAMVIIANLFLAYCKKKSKVVSIISLSLIALLMCGFRIPMYGDFENYSYMYAGIQPTTIGLTLIFRLLRTIGLDFWNAHYLILAINLCTVLITFYKFSINPHFAISLFTGYYIIISSAQIKNHTAMIFLLIALMLLYDNKKWISVVFILLATLIHYSFIVFFLSLLFVNENKDKLSNTIVKVAIVITCLEIVGVGDILLFLVNRMTGLVERFFGTYGVDKLITYTEDRSKFGYIIFFILYLMDLGVEYLAFKWLPKNETYNTKVFKVKVFSDRVNLISVVTFPLLVYNQQWYRIMRDILLLKYIIFGNAVQSMKLRSQRRLILIFMSVSSILVWLIADLILKTDPNIILIPFFKSNTFLP